MFFFLSKTVNYLFMPLTVVCMLLLGSVLIRSIHWKKRLFWAGFILLLFFSNDFIANEIMRAWEIKARPFNAMTKHELGIVLTGSTIPFLKPDDRVYFQRGADRVTHTVQLYKLGLLKKILISGGSGRLNGEDEPEADKFKKAMLLMGVPDSVILIENETRNTAESAMEVKKMLVREKYKSSDCVLITSAFHMRRSLACYKKVGLELEPFSTDFYAHSTGYAFDILFIPKLEALGIWHKLVKEWIGFVAYKFAGYI
jgi:uncharacterized SAM-binding protein YcdF (DUF218 family)